jgi:hypothetical protein
VTIENEKADKSIKQAVKSPADAVVPHPVLDVPI